jgi:hypothetical protein
MRRWLDGSENRNTRFSLSSVSIPQEGKTRKNRFRGNGDRQSVSFAVMKETRSGESEREAASKTLNGR